MSKPNIAEAATAIVGLLEPFNSEERQRAVQAALTLLGETPITKSKEPVDNDNAGKEKFSSKVKTWLRQNDLNSNQIEQVFHIDGETAEIIASAVPGKTDKDKTLNTYLLIGISRFLTSGEPAFDDKTARQACKNLGCYNDTNHASYMKDKGNRMAGTKEQGWKLTAPGLMQGAILIKEMNT